MLETRGQTMKEEQPESLRTSVELYEAEQEQILKSKKEEEGKIRDEIQRADEKYRELNSLVIAGILIEKAPLVERIFPTVMIHAEKAYYYDKEIHTDKGTYREISHVKTLHPPRLVLSVILQGQDYPSLRGHPGIRTVKFLDFYLNDEQRIDVDHRFRVPTRRHAGRWGNPFGFYWNTEKWTPEGLLKTEFAQEADILLSRFCEKYKEHSLGKKEAPGFTVGGITMMANKDQFGLKNPQGIGFISDRLDDRIKHFKILYPKGT